MEINTTTKLSVVARIELSSYEVDTIEAIRENMGRLMAVKVLRLIVPRMGLKEAVATVDAIAAELSY